jgi:hypothetical protein
MLKKIISGGQTEADQAGLDAATYIGPDYNAVSDQRLLTEKDMKLLKQIVILILVLAMAFAVACPAQDQDGPPVTKEEAQSNLGDTVAAPAVTVTTSGMAPPGLRYHYTITGSLANTGRTGSMEIRLFNAKTIAGDDGLYKTAQDYFNRRKKAVMNAGKRNGRKEVEEVPGLGDSAYWAPNSYTLHIMSHGAYISLKINDLKKFSADDRTELDKKISTHRKQLAEKIARLIPLA